MALDRYIWPNRSSFGSFLPNQHHPSIEQAENLEIPLSRKDVQY